MKSLFIIVFLFIFGFSFGQKPTIDIVKKTININKESYPKNIEVKLTSFNSYKKSNDNSDLTEIIIKEELITTHKQKKTNKNSVTKVTKNKNVDKTAKVIKNSIILEKQSASQRSKTIIIKN